MEAGCSEKEVRACLHLVVGLDELMVERSTRWLRGRPVDEDSCQNSGVRSRSAKPLVLAERPHFPTASQEHHLKVQVRRGCSKDTRTRRYELITDELLLIGLVIRDGRHGTARFGGPHTPAIPLLYHLRSKSQLQTHGEVTYDSIAAFVTSP